MNANRPKSESRRCFLLTSGRFFGLGVLATLVAGQELKRRRLEGDPNCIKLFTCQDCREFNGCTQPKAEQFRLSHGKPVGSKPLNAANRQQSAPA